MGLVIIKGEREDQMGGNYDQCLSVTRLIVELLTKYVAFDIDESMSIDPGWFIDS